MKFFSLFVLAVTMFAIPGCKKHNYSSPDGKRLEQINQRWHDSLYHHFLSYDQEGRISAIAGTGNNLPFDTTNISIEYNSQGKLSGYSYKHNTSPNSYVYTFIYDLNGRIVQKRSGASNSLTNTYAYNDKGRLIADSAFFYYLNDMRPKVTYEYDEAGNLIKWKDYRYSYPTNDLVAIDVAEASYYDQPNPLIDLHPMLFYILEYQPTILSEHLVAKITSGYNQREFRYEHYPNGQVHKVIFNNDEMSYLEYVYK